MAIKPHVNEHELLAEIAIGNERAFAELFRWYYGPLGQSIFKITESTALTQEVVQDTFVKIWLKRADLVHVENFSSYLFIICRNYAFAAIKKLAKERQLQPAIEQHFQWESELDVLENPSEEYRLLIDQAVAKLPAQQQHIYKLSRYEHLKYDEIAAALGISAETVKKQVYNAVKAIRQELSGKMASSMILVLTAAITLHS